MCPAPIAVYHAKLHGFWPQSCSFVKTPSSVDVAQTPNVPIGISCGCNDWEMRSFAKVTCLRRERKGVVAPRVSISPKFDELDRNGRVCICGACTR
eukprot:scaffold270_cov347-Pavlova_lutheri.AAC.35